jgi:NADP-dependent 3-hydroxy acid dehydrogenase YdfG
MTARTLSLALLLLLGGCAGALSRDEQQLVAGKTYVITGATSGIGRGVALRLASMGANVVLAARRTGALQEVARQADAAGGKAMVVTTDVANARDMQRLAEATVARFGRLDVWINNAGVGATGRFDEIAAEDHARVVDVNLKGVIYGSHAALRQFRAQGHGVLINIGSAESQVPQAYHASYSAANGAVLNLGRALNAELRLSGLRGVSGATVMLQDPGARLLEQAGDGIGPAPPKPAPDAPAEVVDAIVRASVDPREEVPVRQ